MYRRARVKLKRSKFVRMDITPKELGYFLFSKKTCPHCGGIMTKEKHSEIVDSDKFVSMHSYIHPDKIQYYYYVFICQRCGHSYRLSELVNNDQ